MTEPTPDQQPWQQQPQPPTQQWGGQQWPQQPQPGYGQPQPGNVPPAYPYGAPVPPPRKSHRGPWIGGSIGAVVLIIIIAVVAGGGGKTPAKANLGASPTFTPVTGQLTTPPVDSDPTTPPADDNSTQDMPLGSTIDVTSDDGATEVTVAKVAFRTRGCGSYPLVDKGKGVMTIDVTYKETSGVGSYNPYDWTIRDTAGNEYDQSGFTGCGTLKSSNGLHGKVHGLVDFEVPPKLRHGEIVYSAGLLDDNPASWKF